jgi:hypothetical protein
MPPLLSPVLRTWSTFGSVRHVRRATPAEAARVVFLRRMIWLYFALLIAEGALRKWAFPSLSAPLLVIRDPLVLVIYMQALRCRRFPVNGPVVTYFLLLTSFILLAFFQIISEVGGGPVVAAYGLRTNFLHLPLIFVIPQVFSYADVVKLGRWVLILSIPMAGLMVWQFLSPADSWVNNATMADTQQISFALGKIRPAGAFSFATGAAHFFVLATAFLMHGLIEPRAGYSRWLLGASLLSVMIVQPASGSRLLVLGCALTVVATSVYPLLCKGGSARILGVAALVCGVLAALSLTSFFREAMTVFMTRWNDASGGNLNESLGARLFGGFLEPFALIPQVGLFGQGIGLGTNVASTLMTGTPQFLLAESEWSRVIMEAGPLLGFSFLAYRTWLAGNLVVRAAGAARRHNLLAWLLAWDGCRTLLTEQIAQPTNLGFMVLVSGFCLAAIPMVSPAIANRHSRTRPPLNRTLHFQSQFPR